MARLQRPDLGPGPRQDLSVAMHDLHRRSGWPAVRDLESALGHRVVGRSRIHDAFTHRRLPNWGLLELLVTEMAGRVPGVEPHQEVLRFHQLWDLAAQAEEDQAREDLHLLNQAAHAERRAHDEVRSRGEIAVERLESMNPETALRLLKDLDIRALAALMVTMNLKFVSALLESMDPADLDGPARALASMDRQASARILSDVDSVVADAILALMPPEAAENALVQMEPRSAAKVLEMMVPDTAIARIRSLDHAAAGRLIQAMVARFMEVDIDPETKDRLNSIIVQVD